uniref:Class I SAM-dependent methyltransferase n=1 Tax=Eiseniibacteriota bacterium TaxID=2212470 RepID=A0A832I2G0_UNCEI
MPTSEHRQIPHVCDVLQRERPRAVLDVGAGWGKYGLLAREYGGAERVDAVDVNPPRYPVYDHVWLGDLRALERVLPADAPHYDLALIIDVLEHLEKPDAFALLDRLVARASKVLVTTPWGFRPQEVPGQPFETHRSGWHPWDFSRRYRLHRWSAFPGHRTRHLRLPRLWQLLAVVGARGTPRA